jgi:hypothetical protein
MKFPFAGLIVACLLACAPVFAVEAGLPWKAGDDPPVIAGITLGESRTQVEATLGKAPETKPDNTNLALIYVDRGLVVMLNGARQAAAIFLLTAAAGDVDGIHAGDDRERVIARWGQPQLVQGAEAMYIVGNWAVVIELGAAQKVAQLSVTRVFGNTTLE